MARVDELRLMAKVARLYHKRGLRQSEVADRLDLTQSSVSRLLRRAQEEEIVRITIREPLGIHAELEEALRAKFDLKAAVVVDCERDEEPELLRSIGSATAFYLQTTLKPNDVIGMAASGPSLVAVVDAVHPQIDPADVQIVQILGDFGNPAADEAGTHLVRRLAAFLGGRATLLPAPALAPSSNARRLFLEDRFVREAMHMFERVTLALVGLGNCDWSRAAIYFDDSSFPPHEMEMLDQRGAVGDICLRFFDISGTPVLTPVDDRVIAIALEQLQQVERVVCTAGGRHKLAAIQGALSGGWINVLITDHFTAERLVQEQDPSQGSSDSPRGVDCSPMTARLQDCAQPLIQPHSEEPDRGAG